MKSTFFSYSLSLVFVGTSIAETINVPDDHALIQDAINASSDGDVINIASGTYNEHTLNPAGKAITIQGTLNEDGSLATTIDALQAGIVFEINSGETYETLIKDLVITGGTGFYGGGIFCDGLSTMSSATIDGCRISDNTGGFGGGIFASADCVINDCTIENNLAIASGGGIYCVSSQNTITDCTVEGNEATSEGGGIYSFGFGELLISGCTITGNTCQDDGAGGGAGIRGYLGDTTIIDCTISDNTATSVGGGIMTSSTTITSGCTISDNTGGLGGGLYSVSTHLITISSTVVCGNTSGQIYFDDWNDGGDNCISDDCTNCSESKKCPGDLDGDDSIGFSDVLIVLSDWGCSGDCTSDVDDDDSVEFSDVLIILSDWGACP